MQSMWLKRIEPKDSKKDRGFRLQVGYRERGAVTSQGGKRLQYGEAFGTRKRRR